MSSLRGKTAVVTGASSGMGAATVRLLTGEGVTRRRRRAPGRAPRRARRRGRRAAPRRDRPGEQRAVRIRGRRRARRDRHPRQQRRPRPRPRARSGSRPRRTRRTVIETNVARAAAHDAALPPAHPRRRAHRQHRLHRRPPGVRERRRLHHVEVRGARVHVCPARGPARPADPPHDRRRAASSRRSSRRCASAATPSARGGLPRTSTPLTADDIADCVLFAVTPAAAREHRRDRREGASRSRAAPASTATE